MRTISFDRTKQAETRLAFRSHAARRMNRRSTRFYFVSEWLLEFSVLWAVFPILTASVVLTVLSFVVGILIRPGEE